MGTGRGYSVKEIIETVKKISKNDFQTEITGRRAGDPAVLIADNKKASSVLGWTPKYGLNEIIESAWNWHQNKKF